MPTRADQPDLKPCPFCGSEPELRKHNSEDYDFRWADVHCSVCEATIHRSARSELGGDHVSAVVRRWNRRATDGLISDMIESLRRLKSD
jgi:Lar family restriction alleviation protein